jgi:hypothetical protein
MIYLTFLFSSFITQSLILPITLFLSAKWWFTLKRYLCYTLYIVKAKENSKEIVWQIIMVDGEWCGSLGGGVRKGKVKEMKIVQMQMICVYG